MTTSAELYIADGENSKNFPKVIKRFLRTYYGEGLYETPDGILMPVGSTEAKDCVLAMKESGWPPSRIVLGTIGILVMMQELAGLSVPFGISALKASPSYPDQGDCCKAGSQDFTEFDELLQNAFPVTWTGPAARAYIDANNTLIELAKKMTDLDRSTRRSVNSQAQFVAQTQLGLGITQDVLVGLYLVVYYLEQDSTTFWWAFALACSAALGAITAGIILLVDCSEHSAGLAKDVDALSYQEVSTAAQQVIDAYQHAGVTGGMPAGGSVAGNFGNIAVSIAAPSAGAAGAWRHQRTSGPTVSTAPDRERQSTLEFTMPSRVVRHPAGSAANLAGGRSRRGDGGNDQGRRGAFLGGIGAADREGDAVRSDAQDRERVPADSVAQAPRPGSGSGTAKAIAHQSNGE